MSDARASFPKTLSGKSMSPGSLSPSLSHTRGAALHCQEVLAGHMGGVTGAGRPVSSQPRLVLQRPTPALLRRPIQGQGLASCLTAHVRNPSAARSTRHRPCGPAVRAASTSSLQGSLRPARRVCLVGLSKQDFPDAPYFSVVDWTDIFCCFLFTDSCFSELWLDPKSREAPVFPFRRLSAFGQVQEGFVAWEESKCCFGWAVFVTEPRFSRDSLWARCAGMRASLHTLQQLFLFYGFFEAKKIKSFHVISQIKTVLVPPAW